VLVPEVSRAPGHAHKGAELDDVFRAVADLRVLSFRHVSGKPAGARPDRGARMTVHPYAMVLFRGEAHCIARDTATNRVEVYPVSRMRESEPSESDRFELPEDFNVQDFIHGPFGLGRPQHPIVVEFSPHVADEVRAQRMHSSQRTAIGPDGRVRLSIQVPSLEGALAWVLQYGSSARVIEPPELRDAVMRELKSAMQRYGR
jgi:predicted DNA-binding transcriptional regulator YafY